MQNELQRSYLANCIARDFRLHNTPQRTEVCCQALAARAITFKTTSFSAHLEGSGPAAWNSTAYCSAGTHTGCPVSVQPIARLREGGHVLPAGMQLPNSTAGRWVRKDGSVYQVQLYANKWPRCRGVRGTVQPPT